MQKAGRTKTNLKKENNVDLPDLIERFITKINSSRQCAADMETDKQIHSIEERPEKDSAHIWRTGFNKTAKWGKEAFSTNDTRTTNSHTQKGNFSL